MKSTKGLPQRQSKTKTLRAMKIAIIVILITCLQVSAKSYSQNISLSVKQMPLEKVFSEIKKESGFDFVYNNKALQSTHNVTLTIRDASIEEVLKACLKGQSLDFKIINQTILISQKEGKTQEINPAAAKSGLIDIKGKVTNKNGEPLAGASIQIKGSKKGTETDREGSYELKAVADNAVLIVSFTGYINQEIDLNGKNFVPVILQVSANPLDAIQVIAYGSVTKRLNTGNVTTIKGEDIQKQPVSDPMMALEGRVPGLQIAQTSGIPGAGLIVQLRGRNSIANGNDPLYIVDGVPFTSTSLTNASIGGGALGSPPNGAGQGMSPFNSLNPADIESIEVLKDADATAIYGSRGANGVILITTKKGKEGVSKFEVNAYSGIGKAPSRLHLLNTSQYLAMRHKAFYNDSIDMPSSYTGPGESDYDINGSWDTSRYTDWQKKMIGGEANFTNGQTSLSGGDARTQFMINGGYSRQTSVFPGSFSDKKASIHFNLSHTSVDQKFHSLFVGQYMNDNSILPLADFTSYITLAPDAPAIYDADGHINWQNGSWVNPLASTLQTAKAATKNLMGNLTLNYEVLKGLQIKGSFGYTHIQMNQSNQSPATANFGPPDPNSRTNFFATTEFNTWIFEPQINYARRIGSGKLDVLVGSTLQKNTRTTLGQLALGFSGDALIPNIAAASNIYVLNNGYSNYRYAAVFGRVNYNWREKYLLNITARRDGSSRFGPGKQFGNFGAIGAGWIFTNEPFFRNELTFLSFGKLRASYGSTGNDQIDDYQYLSTYVPYTNSTYQNVTGLYPTKISNPYFGWEVVKKLEFGIELGMLRDRILLNADFYRNRTGNQLVGQPLPSIDGFNSIQANLPAVVQNSGLEIQLSSINIKAENFSWTSSFNISIPRNKLVSFPGLSTNNYYKNIYAIGKPLFTRPGYHYLGVDQQTGVYTFEDVNKDGAIDFQDNQFLKQVAQNFFGGFQNKFSYKGWQLDIFFQFVKQTGFNNLLSFLSPGYFNQNQPVEVLNTWQNPGDKAPVQQYTTLYGTTAGQAFSNVQQSDAVVSDASFIRLKTVFLSYTLPRSLQQRLRLQNTKIFLQGQNLFTITSYHGLDPETQGLFLPPLRMFTAGIQAAF